MNHHLKHLLSGLAFTQIPQSLKKSWNMSKEPKRETLFSLPLSEVIKKLLETTPIFFEVPPHLRMFWMSIDKLCKSCTFTSDQAAGCLQSWEQTHVLTATCRFEAKKTSKRIKRWLKWVILGGCSSPHEDLA